ncbi:MAG: restriction endonuclease subunit S [Thermoguttaceae bacterium]
MSNGDRLPNGWTETTVASIAKSIQYGHTASATDEPIGPRFLRITDIQNGSVDWDSVPSCTISAVDIDKYRLEAGDIVFARTGATTGKSYLIRECPEAVFASYLIRLRMHDGVFPQYVQSFFQTNDYWRQIEGGKRGIGQPNVNASVLGTIGLPLAPLSEQRRIVAKIEELFSDLDAGVAALQRARAKLKRYRAAVLKAAVEGKFTEEWRTKYPPKETAPQLLERILKKRRRKWEEDQLTAFAKAGKRPPANWKDKYKEPAAPDETDLPALPQGWCWATMESVAMIDGGITKDQKRPRSSTMREVPYLRVANVQRGFLDLTEMKDILAEETEIDALRLQKGDILFTEGGDRDKLGRGWVWNEEIDDCIHQNHIFRARLISDCVQPKFISYHGNYFGQRWFVRTGKQTTNLASINKGVLSRFPIPLAPIEEQEQIVNEADRRLSLIQESEFQIEANLTRSSRLRQSILKRAFEGKLVPQDPNDEPASVLLTNIQHKQDVERQKPQSYRQSVSCISLNTKE